MPNSLLVSKLNKIESPADKNFSLDSVNKLCDIFKVPYGVLLNRVVFDTGFWNCLLLRFKNYETEKNNWKLRERYLPLNYWNNLKSFIPLEDFHKSKDDPNRYPSAKGKLNFIFNSIYQRLKDERRVTCKFHYNEINDSPLKSFFRFYFNGNDEIVIHFSLGSIKYKKGEYLNVCIPLP